MKTSNRILLPALAGVAFVAFAASYFMRANYTPEVRALMDAGKFIFATDFLKAQRLRRVLVDEVRAAFELSVLSIASGRKLSVRPSSQDSKIQFSAASGTGLTGAEVSRISGEVRDIVREKFTPQPVDLP